MQPKVEKFWFRGLPSDKQALEQIAHVRGESMALVLRDLIRERARELGLQAQASSPIHEEVRREAA